MADEKAKVEEKVSSADMPELSKEAEKVLEMVEKMTVLELADLVKVMEEKFGVSAAAPVAVAAAGPAVEAEEEKSAYDIVLKEAGATSIEVIKVVREVTELGLMEAKKLVDTAPQTIKEGVPKEQAEEFKAKFEAAGAKVELE